MQTRPSFDRYLASLVGSWQAFAAPHRNADVVQGDGFVAARFADYPVLNNAILLHPDALYPALQTFTGATQYAIWSVDAATATAIEAAGLRPDTSTVPMCCDLQAAPPPADDDGVVQNVAPEIIADLAGIDTALLSGVPGLWTFVTKGHESGLVLIPVADTTVRVSFVTTRESARRRGLGTLVLRRALAAAKSRGVLSASLQSTRIAEHLYGRAGFVSVGRWQAWAPTHT
jgi:GNAT superfamily N-acetyltransferase